MGGGDTTTNSTRKLHTARAPVNRRQVGQYTAHAHAPRAAKKQDATVYTLRVGRTGATTRPVAGAVVEGHTSEPCQAASGTMANITLSQGGN